MAVKSWPIKDGVVDLVYSPDDQGYYLQETKFSEKTDRVSKKTYASAEEAEVAYGTRRVRWE